MPAATLTWMTINFLATLFNLTRMEGPKLSPDDNIVMLLHVVDFGLNIVFFCGNCYYRVKKFIIIFFIIKIKTRPGNQIGSTPLPMVAVGQKGLLLNNYKGSTRPKHLVKMAPTSSPKKTFRPL